MIEIDALMQLFAENQLAAILVLLAAIGLAILIAKWLGE